ncbi:MAG: LytTR family DNA-binding domain-containing protein [Prevotellaceae bacterium]|jgi:two-component system LytT family response regulator|nr:LytTR family DNA-binding domain-containing protein [Prevotellaceae bacterium]
MKAYIVEDEFAPREMLMHRIRTYHPDIDIVGYADAAELALIEILRKTPELLFCDIQLLDKNGLWLAEQLNVMASEHFTPPQVIFTTAYTDSQYLLEAFRLAAVDYLVKPVQVELLKTAVEKAKQRRQSNIQKLMNAFDESKILRFKAYKGINLFKYEDIFCIKADENYSLMTLSNGDKIDVYERLGEIEKRLPADIFLRIDRSNIVNQKLIRKIDFRKCKITFASPKTSCEIEVSEAGVKKMKH